MEMNKFFIKDGYQENLTPVYCKRSKRSIKNQYQIYELAFEQNKTSTQFNRIIDIGCGKAEKLIHFFDKYETTGFDYGENINHCKKLYPKRNWTVCNLDQECPTEIFSDTVILCVDVIEHLVDPSMLLNYLSQLSQQNNLIVVSTPERDVARGKREIGPPKRKTHVREWNESEFTQLLNHFNVGLEVTTWGRYIVSTKLCRPNIT